MFRNVMTINNHNSKKLKLTLMPSFFSHSRFSFPGTFLPLWVFLYCLCCLLNSFCQLHHLPSYVFPLALTNSLVHTLDCDREVPLSDCGAAMLPVSVNHWRSPGDYKAGLGHSTSWQAGRGPHVKYRHEPGRHADGTIPMTLQLGMLPCCTPTEAKESCAGL